TAKTGRYVRLRALTEVNGRPYTSMAELNVLGTAVTTTQTWIPKSGWTLRYVDSQETAKENGSASNAFDGNATTIWHTRWSSSVTAPPHEIQIDLGASYVLSGLRYLPRQD